MDNALGMDDDIDFLIGHVEQPVGFHDFQALISQRRTVDGNLFTHAPVRMF